MIKKFFLIVILSLTAAFGPARAGVVADSANSAPATSAVIIQTEPEMADKMRENGKIYVVVVVLATIFVGIFAYLIRVDRRISKLEKNI